jgi:mannose-6-phosphate isomerase-like protein (cupin superfamily)
MKKTLLHGKPYTLNDGEQRFKSLGVLVSLKASAEQTGGEFNLFDVLCPTGYETPLCIHYAEDVAMFILEGALDIFWGDQKKTAQAGAFFFQPRGTPHGFRVKGKRHARILYMSCPAGFDGFVMAHRQPVTDVEAASLYATYKVEVLGPLPNDIPNRSKCSREFGRTKSIFQ